MAANLSAPHTKAAAARRRALAQKIGSGIVILTAAAPAPRSRDTHYTPYRQNSDLYYLTTCTEPHTALLLTANNGAIEHELLLCRAADPEKAQWDGKWLTPKTAPRTLGIDAADSIDKLPTLLATLAAPHDTLHYAPGADPAIDAQIARLARDRRANNRRGQRFPTRFVDITDTLDEMRLIKDAAEIAQLRAACRLTADGVMAAMRAAPRATHEHEIEAAIINTYRRGGADHAFPPIVAGGANACTLHYTTNNARLKPRAGILVDTGCELHGYAGDITRTFPADGNWRGGLTDIYTIVLAAQKSAIAAAKPGATLQKVEQAAVRKLTDGLRALKLCRGSAQNIIKNRRYRRYYMHSIGHWLGIDVHDVGSVHNPDGTPRTLRPGMVLTIEPGLYIPADPDIPRHLAGIGVRIEDNILITKQGNDNLTTTAPKTPADISAWMQTG